MARTESDNDVFGAIADPTRRRLLSLIGEAQSSGRGGAAVGELVEQFDISQPAVSKQLRVLREAGLVEAERDGRRRVYRLSEKEFRKLGQWVRYFDRFWESKLEALGRHLDEEHAR